MINGAVNENKKEEKYCVPSHTLSLSHTHTNALNIWFGCPNRKRAHNWELLRINCSAKRKRPIKINIPNTAYNLDVDVNFEKASCLKSSSVHILSGCLEHITKKKKKNNTKHSTINTHRFQLWTFRWQPPIVYFVYVSIVRNYIKCFNYIKPGERNKQITFSLICAFCYPLIPFHVGNIHSTLAANLLLFPSYPFRFFSLLILILSQN